jgi:hypothetical protein
MENLSNSNLLSRIDQVKNPALYSIIKDNDIDGSDLFDFTVSSIKVMTNDSMKLTMKLVSFRDNLKDELSSMNINEYEETPSASSLINNVQCSEAAKTYEVKNTNKPRVIPEEFPIPFKFDQDKIKNTLRMLVS